MARPRGLFGHLGGEVGASRAASGRSLGPLGRFRRAGKQQKSDMYFSCLLNPSLFFFCGLLGACSKLLGWLKAVAGACGRKKSLGFLGRSRRPPGVPFGFFQGFPGRGQIRGGHGPHRATRSPRWHNIWASCGPVGTSSYRIVVNCCPFLSVPVINSCPFPSLP